MMQQARRPLKPHADRENKSKSNLLYTSDITPEQGKGLRQSRRE